MSTHYLLFYQYTPDYLQKREPHRAEHLRKGWEAVERGELILGGVLDNPGNSAALLFSVDSPQVIEDFVKNDPYFKAGIIEQWQIRPWSTVIGNTATTPIRPEKA